MSKILGSYLKGVLEKIGNGKTRRQLISDYARPFPGDFMGTITRSASEEWADPYTHPDDMLAILAANSARATNAMPHRLFACACLRSDERFAHLAKYIDFAEKGDCVSGPYVSSLDVDYFGMVPPHLVYHNLLCLLFSWDTIGSAVDISRWLRGVKPNHGACSARSYPRFDFPMPLSLIEQTHAALLRCVFGPQFPKHWVVPEFFLCVSCQGSGTMTDHGFKNYCPLCSGAGKISCLDLWKLSCNARVHTMATEIFSSRAYQDLPILADALEESGCADSSILAHCRSTKSHARGCWVLELLRNHGDDRKP